LIIWIMSHIERFFKRIVPEKLHTILVPASVLLLTSILGLIVVGPIGSLLTQSIVAASDTRQPVRAG
jgi:PTS system beta-glucosides-specific IIC component